MTVHSDSGASRRSFESWLIAQARKDTSFKQRLLENPKAVIAKECGTQLPVGIEIRVLEETEKILYIVLPYSADRRLEEKESQ